MGAGTQLPEDADGEGFITYRQQPAHRLATIKLGSIEYTMKWKKRGLVFVPEGDLEWMNTHAANPVVEHLGDDLFRIFFSSRDLKNRSQIAALDARLSDQRFHIIDEKPRLVLTHGKNGRFDDSGVTVTGLVRHGSKRLLYYLGWNLGVSIPFRNAIGVAICEGPDTEFERISEGPLIDRNHIDPISLSYPFLLWDNERFKIWYGSCMEWVDSSISTYQFSIKYAESTNGLDWDRRGEVAIGCDSPNEDAVARPHVIQEDGLYKMWYSRKKGPYYRLGYAESEDGRIWLRMDDRVGLDVTAGEEWDSEMIEYSFLFDHKGHRYMLYNGNGYGKSGFGLAILAK